MNRQKAIAYSMLAHIRNTSTLVNGPLDIFVPLIRRAISMMNKDGVFTGKNIYEINEYSVKLYDMNFPLPVLRKILEIIINDIDALGQGAFIVNDDDSFSISNYAFTEFDALAEKRKYEIEKLEELFQDFCNTSDLEIQDSSSIFSFLEKNKLSLAKYLSTTEGSNGHSYTAEVQFVDYFKHVPVVYELIKSLYLGSILSEYIEYTPSGVSMNIELLLDTNFIISLIDLNTPESTHTCNTLIDIAKSQGYKLSILPETLGEIKYLLQSKSENFNKSFMVKKIYTEDIYNACDRLNLTKIDLERIIDNIEQTISSLDIVVVTDYSEIKEEALKSEIYAYYRERRPSLISAKHDAIALYYVKKKRGQDRIKDFGNVNCWFVNNAVSRNISKSSHARTYQPDIIKADDLLSILWLSNPQVNKLIPSNNIANIGLSSLISLTFTESLPKTSIIKEFEHNIQKYRTKDIQDEDIVRVANRIVDKQLTDIDELNKLAEENTEAFIERLEQESKKQLDVEKERIKSISNILERFKSQVDTIDKIKENKKNIEKSESILREQAKKDGKEIKRQAKVLKEQEASIKTSNLELKVKKWQLNSRLLLLTLTALFFMPIGYIYYFIPNLIDDKLLKIIGVILTAVWFFISKTVYDRHFNESNIKSFKDKHLD